MTDNHKAANVPCNYHCEGGWLPAEGTRDEMELADTIRDIMEILFARPIPLLVPTTFIPCFTCSELSWINDDIK